MEFLTLERVPRAVTTARHWVVQACLRQGLDETTCDALELVTAEMVGNAVKHGEGRIDLTLEGPTVWELPGGPDRDVARATVHERLEALRRARGEGEFGRFHG